MAKEKKDKKEKKEKKEKKDKKKSKKKDKNEEPEEVQGKLFKVVISLWLLSNDQKNSTPTLVSSNALQYKIWTNWASRLTFKKRMHLGPMGKGLTY